MSLRVVQVVTGISIGDAISSIILGIDREARAQGLRSEIVARKVFDAKLGLSSDPKLDRLTRLAREDARGDRTVFIYHYGIADPVLDRFFEKTPLKRRVFYYHNFTPPEFFKGWERGEYKKLKQTERTIGRLMARRWTITGDSFFNLSELKQWAHKSSHFLPPVLPPLLDSVDAVTPEQVRQKALIDLPSLLFVGRFCPHKRQDLLLIAMRALLDSGLECRLSLVGRGDLTYTDYIRGLMRALKLRDHVNLLTDVNSLTVRSCYRFSNYLLITSEHEGFCLPVVEGLRSGCIPISWPVAAIADIMKGAPTLTSRMDLAELCRLAHRTVAETHGRPDQFVQKQQAINRQVEENLAAFARPEDFVGSLVRAPEVAAV